MQDIDKKLRTLSIIYAILGWLCVPASFIAPAIIVWDIRTEPPPFPVPAILTAIAVLTLAASLAMSACLLLAGRAVADRRRRTFVLVVSAILCFSVPIGTAIGIFAMVVLNDPQVRQQFDTEAR